MRIKIPTNRTIPYRNDYTYFLRPWQSGNNRPELFAEEVLRSAEGNSIIIADGTTVYPIWYVQQVKGLNPDIKVVSKHRSYNNPIEFPTADTIKEITAEREVYVVSPVAGYCPAFLLENYDFIEAGVLYEVVKKRGQ